MTGPVIYELVKFWLPLITAGGLIIRVLYSIKKMYTSTKISIVTWADLLMKNHMAHIQVAVEKASSSLSAITKSNEELSATMRLLREDFVENRKENQHIQTAILTGIEVLKDRE